MIGLLIQDNQYEQDIRELLMSFYPGETYAHEVKDGLGFYVETRLGDSAVSVLIWENGAAPEAGSYRIPAPVPRTFRTIPPPRMS